MNFQEKKLVMAMSDVKLSEVTVGSSVKISYINAKGYLRSRLMDMGLVKGEILKIIRVAPLGDPIDIEVKGYDLSLRKKECEKVIVLVVN